MNRCLAEGRERFRAFLSRSESGGRCAELRPLLSAFCDGESEADDAAVLREHLRACAQCRATMRAYRAAPRALAALSPLPLVSRSLLERAHDALHAVQSRLPGQRAAAESAVTQVAAGGGGRGAGMAGLAKLLAICAGTAGGAAACVGAGVVPAPLDLAPDTPAPAPPVRVAPVSQPAESTLVDPSPAPADHEEKQGATGGDPPAPVAVEAGPEQVENGAVEYAPAAAPAPAAAAAGPSGPSPGSAAGEFGP